MIHCVLVFGWSGSPGEYMAFAWGAKCDHERHCSPNPRRDDAVRFSSKWLMDDGVILEACVGLRPWLSADALDQSLRKVWGPEAINEEKREEEGEPKEEQLIWGLHMNFTPKTVRLPEPNCVKGRYLLALPELQPGCREVPLKVVQELRSSAQFWCAAQPAIGPELPVMDRLLGSGSAWAQPLSSSKMALMRVGIRAWSCPVDS